MCRPLIILYNCEPPNFSGKINEIEANISFSFNMVWVQCCLCNIRSPRIRIKKWFESSTSFSYSISTGQSNSANQSLAEILQTGNTVSAKELYLVWDSPIDAKTYALIRWNENDGLWGKKWLNKFSVYTEAIF